MSRNTKVVFSCAVLAASTLLSGLWLPAHAGESPGQKCSVTKMKAAFHKAFAEGRCHEKAVATGVPVDPTCLAKATTAFTTAFQHAEDQGGCGTVDDAAAIEAQVDTFVDNIVTALPTVGIHIISVTYGANCGHPTDDTVLVQQFCEAKMSCSFSVDNNLPDPAFGCSKDFSMTYACDDQPSQTLYLVGPYAISMTASPCAANYVVD